MTGGQGAFVDRLRAVMTSGDVQAADELLESLQGEDLREARQWFGADERWARRFVDDHVLALGDYQWTLRVEWISALCAVRLSGPRTAATRIPWGRLWSTRHGPDLESLLVRRLEDMPAQWCAEFVDAASRLKLTGDNGAWTMASTVRKVVEHHRLPCPQGAAFLAHWLAGTSATDDPRRLADWLAADPLMPDLLWGFLAHGDAGRHPELPQALAILVDARRVDRTSLVEAVLAQLTTGPRAGAQGVLAATLAALRVRAAEVPGGLGFLVGVLSASHRSVQPVLLPMALALATDADDWRELVGLVSGRPEKKAKDLVLAGLKAAASSGQVGGEVLETLFDDLGSGDDAAFSAKVAKVRSSLGVAASTTGDAGPAPVLGLWDLEPAPQGGVEEPHPYYFHPRRTPGWADVLQSSFDHRERVRPWLVDRTLASMADGTFDGSEIVAAAEERLAAQDFLCSAMVTATEDLFLAGGLRHGWSTAVRVADLAAGAPKRPARLADLVRLLARYAREVRQPAPLPSHLASLAADRGTSKVVTEARVLAAALDAPDPAAAVPETPVRRGLWEAAGGAPLPTRPETVRLTDDPILVRAQDLAGLGELLAEDFNGWSQSFVDVCWWTDSHSPPPSTTGLTEPDRVLAATVAAVGRHGAAAVREALGHVARAYGPVHVVAAVDCWVAGAADVQTFWHVASRPAVSEYHLMDTWRTAGATAQEARERRDALPSFADRLRAVPGVEALVVPLELDSALSRFTFLRAVEALVRAEEEPTLLSTPTWRDGTLDADDLIGRLRLVAQRSGVVGPLDLVQALHRLREVDPRLVDDVPGGLRTDPRFTAADGLEGWDATALVQRWILRGGLPALAPRAAGGRWQDPPATPVPFARLVAWPSELADDPWCPGPVPDALRLHPRWVDRCFEDAFQEWSFDPRHLPSLAAGPFGVPFHDRLLALLTPVHNRGSFQGSSTLLMLARAGVLDADAMASAARQRHEAGTLSLTLLTRTFQRELDGSLAALWPLLLAVADGLCGAARRPAQLADLLRVLTAYAHEVPADAAAVPPGLLALAEATGSSKAHEAARELVAALREVAR